MLAHRMLCEEVAAVEAALQLSLTAGRERLQWLVSRDVTTLSAAEVRESAIETLAENLNDSVVAPLFWFAVAGLPGAVLYRVANTADAMWGYRGVRAGRVWTWAGKWAARVDDGLSWPTARLTAALLWAGLSWARWRSLSREAEKTPSPNGGWCMGAMALALGVRLGKPRVYVLNPQAPAPDAASVALALEYAEKIRLALVFLALIAIFSGLFI
jgi:adenosylcobinamide-phosphate synthase